MKDWHCEKKKKENIALHFEELHDPSRCVCAGWHLIFPWAGWVSDGTALAAAGGISASRRRQREDRSQAGGVSASTSVEVCKYDLTFRFTNSRITPLYFKEEYVNQLMFYMIQLFCLPCLTHSLRYEKRPVFDKLICRIWGDYEWVVPGPSEAIQ